MNIYKLLSSVPGTLRTCQLFLMVPCLIFLFMLQHSCHEAPRKHHLIMFSNHLQNVKVLKLCPRLSKRNQPPGWHDLTYPEWCVLLFIFDRDKTGFCNEEKIIMIFKIHVEFKCVGLEIKVELFLNKGLVFSLFIMLHRRSLVIEIKVVRKKC